MPQWGSLCVGFSRVVSQGLERIQNDTVGLGSGAGEYAICLEPIKLV